MSTIPPGDAPPVESVKQLVDYFRAACKPRSEWLLGTEHELIGVSVAEADFGDAVPYEGPRGIRALLGRLERRGWAPIFEGNNPIAMARHEAQVTLEPGGQLELSSRPVRCTDELRDDHNDFLSDVFDASENLQLAWLCVGFRPFQRIEDVPWVPKGRYRVMRDYLPTRGRLAPEMMKRTATVQLNVDYSNADDARTKLRASMAVTSLVTAIYANSPIVDEKPSGYQCYRARVWEETDPDRCGLLPFVFEDGDVFEAYTQWAVDVPMFFVYRDGYVPAGGMTFRQFVTDGFQHWQANLEDWVLHLSTLFPDARMKAYIEVRACDAGSDPMVLALGPLCRGFLYDDDARREAAALTASLSFDQRVELQRAVAVDALRARVPGTTQTVGELARELVTIAEAGLWRQEPSELPYLDPVREIVDTGRTQADAMLELWERTGGDRSAVIAEVVHRLP